MDTRTHLSATQTETFLFINITPTYCDIFPQDLHGVTLICFPEPTQPLQLFPNTQKITSNQRLAGNTGQIFVTCLRGGEWVLAAVQKNMSWILTTSYTVKSKRLHLGRGVTFVLILSARKEMKMKSIPASKRATFVNALALSQEVVRSYLVSISSNSKTAITIWSKWNK